MNIIKERKETSRMFCFVGMLFVFILFCSIHFECYGESHDAPFATICYNHWVHRPLSKTILTIYDDRVIASLVADKYEYDNTIVSIDSIYGTLQVSDCVKDSIILLLKYTYLQERVNDYLVNEPSEWATVSDSNLLEIEFSNGRIYEYSIGDLKKSSTQCVGARVIQYSYSFRKLAKLIELIHNQMLVLFMFR